MRWSEADPSGSNGKHTRVGLGKKAERGRFWGCWESNSQGITKVPPSHWDLQEPAVMALAGYKKSPSISQWMRQREEHWDGKHRQRAKHRGMQALPSQEVVLKFSLKGRPGSRATNPLIFPKVLSLLGKEATWQTGTPISNLNMFWKQIPTLWQNSIPEVKYRGPWWKNISLRPFTWIWLLLPLSTFSITNSCPKIFSLHATILFYILQKMQKLRILYRQSISEYGLLF